MRKVPLLIGFLIIIVGAIFLPISQLAGKTIDYQLKDTVNFVQGQPIEFNWTFEKGKGYRFEVYGVSWTQDMKIQLRYEWVPQGSSSIWHPSKPWIWNLDFSFGETQTYKFTFEIETSPLMAIMAEQGTHVNIYEAVETTSKPNDYLLYVGASLAVIGAAVAAIGVAYPVRTIEKKNSVQT